MISLAWEIELEDLGPSVDFPLALAEVINGYRAAW